METIFIAIGLLSAILVLAVTTTIFRELGRARRYKKIISDFAKWENQVDEERKKESKKINEKVAAERQAVFNSRERSTAV